MFKSVWTYIALIAVASTGGWMYYERHVEISQTVPAHEPASDGPAASSEPARDDDLARKRREAIGSIKDLKPVPLPNGSSTQSN